MPRKRELNVSLRNIIIFELSLPRTLAWEFLDEFGELFAKTDPEGDKHLKRPREFALNGKDLCVFGSIEPEEKQKFLDFLEGFCEKRKIPFFEIQP